MTSGEFLLEFQAIVILTTSGSSYTMEV